MKNVKLYQGDCLKVMPTFTDASIDMILCDLPYQATKNTWDTMIPFEPLWEQYWRILKPTGVICLTASQPFTSKLIMSQEKYFRHEWIWIKNTGSNFANTVREPMKEHESVIVFSKGKWTYNKQMQERTGGGLERQKYAFSKVTKTSNFNAFSEPCRQQGTLRVPSSWQKFNVEHGYHPTQKPVALMEYLIRTYTNEGETVLDNCMGSGTTGVACVNTKRKFIGIELDGNYFKIAEERIKHTQPPLF